MVLTDPQWAALHPALGLTPRGERTHPEVLREARERLAQMPTADAITALTAHDIPCAPVVALDELAEQPQVVANDALHVYEHPVLGPIRQPVPMPHMPGMLIDGLRPAPRLGEHSAEILAEAGFSPADTDALIDTGVVGIAR